jgi:hypothetical protein
MASLGNHAVRATAVGAMAAAMFAGGITTASAATGSATVPAGSFAPMGCSSPGGGTWCEGVRVGTAGLKECYSDYIHNQNYHSATAVLADVNDTRYANPGYWANASVTAGWAYECFTYWNN